MLQEVKHIHFVGIGGIGMSSIAAILLARGFKISGSDVKSTPLTQRLIHKGGKIFFGHRPSNLLRGTQLLVYSTSIDEDNPEIVMARKRRIPVLHRSDIVMELVNPKTGVAITGAHGKTTTTALSALLLTKAGFDPTVIVGAEVGFLNGNWREGKGDYVVCEADESDGTFRKLEPAYAVLTNIDREHLDHYKDFKDLLIANRTFIDNIKEEGYLITCYDDQNIKSLLRGYRKGVLTYSLANKSADMYAHRIKMDGARSFFEVIFKGRNFGLFELNIPGKHNIENSMAVILLGIELDIDMAVVKEALSEYEGAARRFEVKGEIDDIMVVEDYAHHPREIMATISACKNWRGRRLIGVFQPHRYTRTKFLKKDFGKSFLGLDELILTDIYAASEKPIEGVSTRVIYDEAVKNGQKNICILEKKRILPSLLEGLRPHDIVLVMGAGDIGELSNELIKGLRTKRRLFRR
jgi:UDP-N-acetylmuramate--alanine ligase